MTGIAYVCPFRSPAGEVCEVLVELTAEQVEDVLSHRAMGKQAGAPGGPLELGYAWHLAAREAPVRFEPLYAQARRITMVH